MVLIHFDSSYQVLTNALNQDPNLGEKLRDTNRHLPWIKNVKERHGSVETSSLQQVEAINQSGIYVISISKKLSLNYQQVEGNTSKEYQKDIKLISL